MVAGKFDLVVSQDILLEYEEIIQIKYGLKTSHSLLTLLALLSNVYYVHPFYKWNLIDADPDDNKYCDWAVSGTADYIVTEDNHFNVLTDVPFPSIATITIDDFLKIV